MQAIDYKKLMNRLLELSSCVIITTGRAGTDFLQSLLDSHPEVLTFNGSLLYHTFWDQSICIAAGKFELSDLVDEFVGKHIEKLKSRYDLFERKDQLGDKYDQSVDINLDKFKSIVMKLLNGREVTSKNSMIAIYASYAMCLGQDIEKKILLFHHAHNFEEFKKYLKDFPDSKIICMTRDPRANFVSGIEHWRRYTPMKDNGMHLFLYIRRILADATPLNRYSNDYITIRIEDVGDERLLREMCEWLNISYNDSLKKSTWGGLSWHGDRLSSKINRAEGWSQAMLDNKWEQRLSSIDKYIFNYIMNNRLKYYNYNYKRLNLFDSIIMPFVIVLPLSYELRFFSWSYIDNCLRKKEYRNIALNIIFYLFRIHLFIKYYLKVANNKKFSTNFLSIDG